MSLKHDLQAEIERPRAENGRLRETVEALRASRAATRRGDPCALIVADVMAASPDVLHLGDNLRAAVERFRRGNYRRLPALDADGRLVGIVTGTDLLRAFEEALAAAVQTSAGEGNP